MKHNEDGLGSSGKRARRRLCHKWAILDVNRLSLLHVTNMTPETTGKKTYLVVQSKRGGFGFGGTLVAVEIGNRAKEMNSKAGHGGSEVLYLVWTSDLGSSHKTHPKLLLALTCCKEEPATCDVKKRGRRECYCRDAHKCMGEVLDNELRVGRSSRWGATRARSWGGTGSRSVLQMDWRG